MNPVKNAWLTPAWLSPLTLAFASALATLPAWVSMVRASLGESDTSTAALAIPVAAYLLWRLHDGIVLADRANWTGVITFVGGMSCYVVGTRLDHTLVAQLGAVAGVWGALASCVTAASCRKLIPVGVAMMFAIEIPGIVSRYISLPLASANASVVGSILEQCGLSVEVWGTLVRAGNLQLQVVDACDGLRIFWAVLLMTYAMCILRQLSWAKSLVALSAVPLLALIANTARILVVAYAYVGASPAIGELVHDFSGMLMMGSGWLMPLVLFSIWLPSKPAPQRPAATSAVSAVSARPDIGWAARIAVIGSLLVTGAATLASSRDQPNPSPPGRVVQDAVNAFPYRLANYVAEEMPIPERQLAVLRPDACLGRRYTDLYSDREFLLIFSYHRDGRSHEYHSVENCYSSLGWSVDDSTHGNSNSRDFDPRYSVCELRRTRNDQVDRISVYSTSLHPTSDEGARSRSGSPRAQLQLVFDPEVSDQTRSQVASEALAELKGCLKLLSNTP